MTEIAAVSFLTRYTAIGILSRFIHVACSHSKEMFLLMGEIISVSSETGTRLMNSVRTDLLRTFKNSSLKELLIMGRKFV